MITIELDMPDLLARKIKALATLTDTKSDLDAMVVEIMDMAISLRIAEILGLTNYESKAQPQPNATASRWTDGLSDGLGDGDEDESNPLPVANMFDLVPKGNLTDKALDDDMEVGDPEHEAKAEAPINSPPYGLAEEMFSKMVGLPVLDPEDIEEVDPRIAKRKKNLSIKGKVSPATSVQESF